MRSRTEKRLERNVLLRVGKHPAVALYPNPVGEGYYGVVGPLLERALPLRIWEEVVRPILWRNRLVYGLGVGSPDLVGSVFGRFWGVELKSEEGRLRPDQRKWHAAARARDCVIDVVRSADEAEEIIEREALR